MRDKILKRRMSSYLPLTGSIILGFVSLLSGQGLIPNNPFTDYTYSKKSDYDSLDKMTGYTKLNSDSVARTYQFDEFDEQDNFVGDYTITFDKQGNVEKMCFSIIFNLCLDLNNTYNSFEQIIRTDLFMLNDSAGFIIYSYDKNGKLVKQESFDRDSVLETYYLFEYDNNGNLSRTNEFDSLGLPIGFITYEYDSDYKMTRLSYLDQYQQVNNSVTFEYNADGTVSRENQFNQFDKIQGYSIYEYGPTSIAYHGRSKTPGILFSTSELHFQAFDLNNNKTRISFELNASFHVKINLFDIQGRLVENFVDQKLSTGSHSLVFDTPRGLRKGIYFYRISAGHHRTAKKLLIN